MESLPARLARMVASGPDRIALVEGGRHVSYATLWRDAQAFAGILHGAGIAPGDRVAIVMPNCPEAAAAIYGTWLAGAVAVPLNFQARSRDLRPWLEHCSARFVVHQRGHLASEQVLATAAFPPAALAVAAGQPLAEAAGAPHAAARASAGPPDVAMILYTSGTTGAPKGVTLSHANLAANVAAVVAYLRLDSTDRVVSVLPFYYAYGASVLHTHLSCGGCVVLEPNLLFPRQVGATLQRVQATGFSGVASTYALLLDHDAFNGLELPRLRYLTQAGGPLPATLRSRLRAALPGVELYLMYGQTEATSRLTWLPPERLDDKPGSVGIPVQGVRLRVVDADGHDVATGEPGEVIASGPGIMHGYWNDPSATATTVRDGWLHTGDIGHLDADGFLFLAGRRSDMIKTGAHRIHPLDIEEAIMELPEVAEVAVYGVDDPLLGQVVGARIVAKSPIARGAAAVRAHCLARLAPYKVPRHVEFVDHLPRTASGKVRRAELAGGSAP